jgi:hypothetical protein
VDALEKPAKIEIAKLYFTAFFSNSSSFYYGSTIHIRNFDLSPLELIKILAEIVLMQSKKNEEYMFRLTALANAFRNSFEAYS